MQLMVNAGIRAVEGYHRSPPQLIKLDVECTGNPKVKKFDVPTKQKVTFRGKAHMQFNCMYVCTLKVANDRHGLTAQPENAGIADFGRWRRQQRRRWRRVMAAHHTPATVTAIDKVHINFYDIISIGKIEILHSNNFLLSIIYDVLCNYLLTALQLWTVMTVHFFTSFFDDW